MKRDLKSMTPDEARKIIADSIRCHDPERHCNACSNFLLFPEYLCDNVVKHAEGVVQ